jgi:hypothetical protein
MISDILCRADPAYRRQAAVRAKLKLGDSSHQPCHVGTVCLLQLKDSIIDVIYSSEIQSRQARAPYGGKGVTLTTHANEGDQYERFRRTQDLEQEQRHGERNVQRTWRLQGMKSTSEILELWETTLCRVVHSPWIKRKNQLLKCGFCPRKSCGN